MEKKICANAVLGFGYCGTELIPVPLFSSVDWVCPICEIHKIPVDIKKKIDEAMRKKFGFEEKKESLPPDPPQSTGGQYGTVINTSDFNASLNIHLWG